MPSFWRQTDLPELVATLATRPGHEHVRTLVADILRNGFGAAYAAFDHEVRLPEVRGRADMLFGATVFEFKSDVRREMADVVSRLPDYLAVAAVGTLCSFGFGWSGVLSPPLLLAFAALYGIAALGNSSVLSTAMSETVPAAISAARWRSARSSASARRRRQPSAPCWTSARRAAAGAGGSPCWASAARSRRSGRHACRRSTGSRLPT